MAKMDVDLAKMREAATHFQTTVSSLKQGGQNVNTTLSTIRSGWHGEAADTFSQSLNGWLALLGNATSALESMQNRLQQGGSNYQAGHSAVSQTAGQNLAQVRGFTPLPI